MNWVLDFAPLLPRAPLLVLSLAALAVALLALRQGGGRGLLRALATALLLLALYNPQLRRELREPLSNIVLVVADHTDSQKIAGRMKQTAAIEDKLQRALKALPGVEVRTLTSRNGDEADSRGTTLFADLNNGLADLPRDRLAGVFLVTDGEVHDVPANLAGLLPDAPVHVLMTGRKGEFDRRIELIEAPRFGLVGSQQPVRLRVVETGEAPASLPRTVQLRLRRETGEEEMRMVPVGQSVLLHFDFPHAGQNILEIAVDGVPGELTEVNNRLVVAAEGIRENLRVLLVSGEPHPGERTWRNLLRSDAAVDLVHFTILRPPEKQDGTPINELSLIAFPTRELFQEKLDQFDLVIFDRYRQRAVLPLVYLDNVARYVENGGAVLLAAGADFADRQSLATTPLAQVLPAEPTGEITAAPYKARVTEAGNRHPVTRDLPGDAAGGEPSWGRWFRLVDTRVTSGDVLMQGAGDKPLLLLDRRGKGRVAMLMSDHAWLWARGYEGGGPYTTLLRRLAHWLMKEPDLEEEFLSATAKGRKLTIERRSMQDRVEPVELQLPTGETSAVALEPIRPGLWRKTVDADLFGLYRLQQGELETSVYVGRIDSRELSVVTATDDKLRPVAEASGGAVVWQPAGAAAPAGDDAAGAAEATLPSLILAAGGRQKYGPGWLAIDDKKAYQIAETRLIPLLSGLIALAVLLAALSLTWLREGRD